MLLLSCYIFCYINKIIDALESSLLSISKICSNCLDANTVVLRSAVSHKHTHTQSRLQQRCVVDRWSFLTVHNFNTLTFVHLCQVALSLLVSHTFVASVVSWMVLLLYILLDLYLCRISSCNFEKMNATLGQIIH